MCHFICFDIKYSALLEILFTAHEEVQSLLLFDILHSIIQGITLVLSAIALN